MDYEYKTVDTKRGTFTVFPGLCKGCGLCMEKCPKQCLEWSKTLGVYGTPTVEPIPEECISCGLCSTVCPDCALLVVRQSRAEREQKLKR